MGPKRNIKDFNPFPGLRPFAPEDSHLFFGREAESEDIILKLLKNRYITVLGASGNGKSSLVYSGVLPKVMNLKVKESSIWKIISFRSGNDPFGNLAGALSDEIAVSAQTNTGRDTILSELLNNHSSFSDVARKYMITKDENVLVVIDQFEELFRYSSAGKSEISRGNAKNFIDFLVNSVTRAEENIFFILTMRSEYLGECSRFKGLAMLVNNSNYLVADLGVDNLRDVIEKPVNYAGAKIEPKLVEVLLNDLKDRPEQLPVLQHSLMRTWSHWQELDLPDKPINKADYDLVGTMNNAISLHADEVYEELSQRGKEICAVMFKTITRKGTGNKGILHPSSVETIKAIAGCSAEELYEVIDKFRGASRSFIVPPGDVILNENSVIDIRNECLTQSWDRLKDWIDTESASEEMYLRLSEASALYQQGKAGLCRPPDLQASLDWRDRQKPTLSWAVQFNPAFERAMVYLRTSEKSYLEEEQNKLRLQHRKIKRIRLITRILGLAVVIAMGFIIFAYSQKFAAEKRTAIAEEQRSRAVREKTKADSSAVIAAESSEDAKEQKVVADIQKNFAEKNAEEALRQRNRATEQSKLAKEALLQADQNAKLAIEQRNAVQRLRMLSIGKSMSLKSLQMVGQKDLQTLLAYQAYLFNKKNNGYENDADIYAGLYNVSLLYGNINYKSFKGHNGEIKSIAFLPGKNEFFTSGNDGKVLKWSLDKKDQTLQVIYSGKDIIEVLAVSPDASWLACGSSSSAIRMIPLKGKNPGYEMNGHKGGIKSLIFSYDGKYLYSAALDGRVLKWILPPEQASMYPPG